MLMFVNDDQNPYPDGPPTLPLPPLWRLLVALAVIVGILYFIYEWHSPQEPAAEPQKSENSVPVARA